MPIEKNSHKGGTMVKLKLLLLYFYIGMFFLPLRAFAFEDQYEDYDSPLSFMIEVMPWGNVKKILPNGTIFIIIDVETSLSFKVQKRAGSRHADVQPMTIKDTKIMKKIYNGKWSWTRRAIIVLTEDQMIAASMNGMPHGAGALKNGFPGHFCVHFWESKTHRNGNLDPAHHLMILKAAGKLDDYLMNIDPYQLIHIFALAANLHDKTVVNEVIAKNKYQAPLTKKVVKDLSYFSIIRMSLLPMEDLDDQLVVEVPTEVEFFEKNKGKTKKFITFVIRRDSLMDRWYIEGQNILKELQ